jgi:hypothetical protein
MPNNPIPHVYWTVLLCVLVCLLAWHFNIRLDSDDDDDWFI